MTYTIIQNLTSSTKSSRRQFATEDNDLARVHGWKVKYLVLHCVIYFAKKTSSILKKKLVPVGVL